MIRLRSFLLLSIFIVGSAHAADTRDCRYWLLMFDEIARIEHAIIVDVPKIRETENAYSAIDYEIDMRERLFRLRRQIDKECGG